MFHHNNKESRKCGTNECPDFCSKAVTKSQVTVSHHSSVASVVEPAQNGSCLATIYVCLERGLGAGRVGQVRTPGRPVAALPVNDPSLRQSQGDVIRGTVQAEGLPRGTEPTTGSSHCPPPLHFLGITAEFGGEPTGTERSFRIFNCLKCFHCSTLSCHG